MRSCDHDKWVIRIRENGWVGWWKWDKSKINDVKDKTLTVGDLRKKTNIIVCGLHFKANKSKGNK